MNKGKKNQQSFAMRDMTVLVSAVAVVIIAYFVHRGWNVKSFESSDVSHQREMPAEEMTRSMSALSDLPEDFLSLVDAGNQYMDQGSYALAAECYRRALALQDAADVRVDYGSCLHGMGLPIRAIEEFKRVLENHPAHGIATYNLGIIYFDQLQVDSARTYFERYLNLNPRGLLEDEARRYLRQILN